MTTTTQSTALTLPERAAVALGESANEAKLRELAAKSAGIVAVTNGDGREEAHRAGMVLLKTRTGIRATGKAARDDATKFSKAVIAMEDQLIAIIEPEEVRVLALRDGFDLEEKTRKDAEIAAELARTAKIADRLEAIREYGADAVLIDKTATSTQATLDGLESFPITDTYFQERLAEAVELKAATMAKIREVLAVRVEAERIEAQRLADIEADRLRMVAEREELAKLRAEAAERERLAKVESDRVAAEQAAEAKRLADLAKEQALDAERRRLAAEAELKAMTDQLAEQARIEQLDRDRVALEAQAKANAELKVAQDEFNAKVAAHDAKVKAEREALEAEIERDRLQALPEQIPVEHDPFPIECTTDAAVAPESLYSAEADDLSLTDAEIIDMGAELGFDLFQWIDRLRLFVDAHATVDA